MPKLTINIDLSEKQKDVLRGARRFTIWRAGRRSGKTYAAEYWFAKRALTNANSVNWYVAQDTALCKELNVPLFEHIVPHELIKSYSKSDRCFTLFNGSRCYFKSANSSDSLRGRGLDSLVAEEAAFWHNGFDIYHNTLRPQLADRLGHVFIISSPPTKEAPTGAEWFRRLEQMFKEEIKGGVPDYASFQSSIYDNPFIRDEEREALKRTTDPATWQIEYMGEYCDKVGQVYWEFDPIERKGVIDEPVLMRIRGMDFGISDNTACVWVNLLNNNRVYISDEYVANNTDIPTHAVAIKRKTIIAPNYTVLDSACWARDATLTSVAKRFAAEGILATQATRDLDGSVSDMKRMMAAGLITINPACTQLLTAIDSWQHGQHEPDVLAATRYAVDALIRTGRLLPPVRADIPDTRNAMEKRLDIEKRYKSLKENLARKAKLGPGPVFRVY